jgi:fused signal recognition particle receptor
MGLFRSAFKKLKAGLSKTSEGLSSLWTGEKLSKDLLNRLEKQMIQADIGVKTAIELTKDLEAAWERNEIETGSDARDYLVELLVAGWPDEDRTLNLVPAGKGPTVILVAGINGAGKTTSIAKIAKSLRDEGKTVILAACDTFRAAAVEQLEIWSHRLGVEVIKGQQGGDPAAVAFDAVAAAIARNADVLIVDTAGRLHTQKPLMDQLAKIKNVIRKQIPDAPHESVLVLDSTVGTNAVNQAKEFAATTEVTGIFLAKLDGTAKGGVVVAIREQLAIPVKFIGVGETPDDVEPFEPEKFVQAMFEG